MKVEIDASKRVNESGPTFVAIANNITYAIKVPAVVKEAGRLTLQERRIRPKLVEPLLWSACVFLVLKPHLNKFDSNIVKITIDNEFDGHQRVIKEAVLRYIRSERGQFSAGKITVDSIG